MVDTSNCALESVVACEADAADDACACSGDSSMADKKSPNQAVGKRKHSADDDENDCDDDCDDDDDDETSAFTMPSRAARGKYA